MDSKAAFEIDTFMPYMRDVMRCEHAMQGLNQMWRMIDASAKMNCQAEAHTILRTMAGTRDSFSRLEQELVLSMATEKVANVLDEIGTKAQYIIDIVVRNLFERTADIGFLATDRELCAFVAGLHDDRDAIADRLRAYRDKYTVYDEIMLLAPDGTVLAQIDGASPVAHSRDALIAQSLTSDAYVETFRASDLRPHKDRALVYSRRMLHPDTDAVVGVLCLFFSFEEEMAGIFHSHRDPKARSNMLLLDGANRVIASADTRWIPLGAELPVNRDGSAEPMMYSGRQYLIRTIAAEGYQGYMGPPGWQGQVMIPVEVAFSGAKNHALAALEPSVAEGLLSHARSFCPPLYEIMTAAENAAETIRRVVWNGQVMTAGQQRDASALKTVLDQISETGTTSNKLFAQSIRDLYETVLASDLNNAAFMSHLLVDLLDRNLYERSDDCRWWALTPELRVALAAGEPDDETKKRLAAILAYINGLYTVYSRLVVYDRLGRIVAVTNDAAGDGNESGALLGTHIDGATLDRVRALSSAQDYHVTPFEPSPLSNGEHTYIYHAAIRHPDNEAMVVGGIGIVFDSKTELLAMLKGALRDKDDMSACFVDRAGVVIASTDAARPVGTHLILAPDLLALANGDSASRIVEHDGNYAIVGCSASTGYREFKVSDGYRDDVLAVVFHLLGAVREAGSVHGPAELVVQSHVKAADAVEFATFTIDGDLFALPGEFAVEAIPAADISPVSMGGGTECIGIISMQDEQQKKSFVWVFDLGQLIRGKPSRVDGNSPVIIVRQGTRMIGLLVSQLHGVPEFGASQLVPTPLAAAGKGGMLVSKVIKANAGKLLIQAVDVEYLFKLLTTQETHNEIDMLAYG